MHRHSFRSKSMPFLSTMSKATSVLPPGTISSLECNLCTSCHGFATWTSQRHPTKIISTSDSCDAIDSIGAPLFGFVSLGRLAAFRHYSKFERAVRKPSCRWCLRRLAMRLLPCRHDYHGLLLKPRAICCKLFHLKSRCSPLLPIAQRPRVVSICPSLFWTKRMGRSIGKRRKKLVSEILADGRWGGLILLEL